jgi:Fe-S cluster biogenesis protein NfuA
MIATNGIDAKRQSMLPAELEALKANLITDAIADLRPTLQRHGGDCELIRIEGSMVHVRLSGACVGCALATVTVAGVQQRLMSKLGFPIRVVQTN